MKKTALITGITGQDGSYLAEFLLNKDYNVHGMVRRVAAEDESHRYWRLRHIKNRIKIHAGSLESYASIINIITKIKPNEIYHLGAQSYIDYAFKDEFSTINTNINGTHFLLSAIKEFSPKTKFYFAGSSEMFGKVRQVPQTEKTPFYPRSVYGISKVAGFDLTRNYREAYKLFCCSGILFNHESPRRGFEFVTRKITHSVARIKFGLQKDLKLGNIDAKRDWGHAKDYVEAMWLMLNQKKPDDYVISTGKHYSVKDFTKLAFELVDLDFKKYLKIEKNLYRPSEVESLLGNCNKAKKNLKWKPKYDFKRLVKDMVQADLEFVEKEVTKFQIVKKILRNFFKSKADFKKTKYINEILPKIVEFGKALELNKTISFLHYGHLGDIINSLPVIKEISKHKKCNLYIQKDKPIPDHVISKDHPFGSVYLTKNFISKMLPLLRNQKYLEKVEIYENQEITIDLNFFRELPINFNIDSVRWYSHLTGCFPDLSIKYLEVNAYQKFKDYIVIMRSLRRQNQLIDYSFLSSYKNIVFVGLKNEFYNQKIKSII